MNYHLSSAAAVKKLDELVDASPNCLFGTNLAVMPVHVCPMQVQEVDERGDLWFFSGADSAHNRHIQEEPLVQLFFTNNGDYQFLTVFGRAEISRDADKIDELWDASVEAWFPEGKTDPNVTLIRVTPEDAHYWASKDGKVVTLIKMLGAAISGNRPDSFAEGDLNV